MFEIAGLDIGRLLSKLNELLDATFEKHFKDESLGIFTDNKTRMEAAKLLAEILGVRKNVIDHNHNVKSGVLKVSAQPTKDEWLKQAELIKNNRQQQANGKETAEERA